MSLTEAVIVTRSSLVVFTEVHQRKVWQWVLSGSRGDADHPLCWLLPTEQRVSVSSVRRPAATGDDAFKCFCRLPLPFTCFGVPLTLENRNLSPRTVQFLDVKECGKTPMKEIEMFYKTPRKIASLVSFKTESQLQKGIQTRQDSVKHVSIKYARAGNSGKVW